MRTTPEQIRKHAEDEHKRYHRKRRDLVLRGYAMARGFELIFLFLEVKRSRLLRKASGDRYALANPEKRAEKYRKWALNNKDNILARHRRRLYGLTPEQLTAMHESQQGLCAICKSSMENFHVDHCHKTGLVRGLLCHWCNIGLGNFVDSPERLQSAIEYLKCCASK